MATVRSDLLYQDQFDGGKHWSFTLKRGTILRLIDGPMAPLPCLLFQPLRRS